MSRGRCEQLLATPPAMDANAPRRRSALSLLGDEHRPKTRRREMSTLPESPAIVNLMCRVVPPSRSLPPSPIDSPKATGLLQISPPDFTPFCLRAPPRSPSPPGPKTHPRRSSVPATEDARTTPSFRFIPRANADAETDGAVDPNPVVDSSYPSASQAEADIKYEDDDEDYYEEEYLEDDVDV